MRACVVGAGPGGIVSTKVLLENGFDVTVFDKYQQVGGTS
ncbi:NAD(P)-binding protein [Streptomyces scabiei]|nr:NAD(P)-binding protein [Streptomyces scabiei]MDW8804739.1 NAD(P)-binding protein [Streptomyces scabiei]